MSRARLLVVLVGLSLPFAGGCDDDASGTAGAGGAATGAGGGDPLSECGPGPYVAVTGTLRAYTTNAPIVGAQLTSDTCPTLMLTTDDAGATSGRITSGMPYLPRAIADGFIPMRTGEQILTTDFDAGVPMFETSLTSVLPHWSETSPTTLAFITFGDTAPQPDPADPCTTVDGVTISVVGHPEAVVTYYAGTTLPVADASLTSTGAPGLAEISGLAKTASGELIELMAEKTGCELSFDSYPHTGRYVLEDGVLTLAAAFMPPVAAP